MHLIDTHCHIHESTYLDAEGAYARAREAGIETMICVGTSEQSSREAVAFAATHDNAVASIGVHPHDTKDGYEAVADLAKSAKVVAVGEIGLDYFYTHSPRETQIRAFEVQLQVARERNLPVIFHVREAFDDFWPILANFPEINGVLHSYTDTVKNLETALEKGLLIGVNGISTFAHDKQAMWDAVPLEKMLLETDAPFLTPVPFRGKVNEPAFVRNVAEYHAHRRQITLEHLARVTSANAHALFAL